MLKQKWTHLSIEKIPPQIQEYPVYNNGDYWVDKVLQSFDENTIILVPSDKYECVQKWVAIYPGVMTEVWQLTELETREESEF